MQNPNLFPPLQGMLQRSAESVDLASALRLVTIEGARAVGRADTQGSLEPGKSVDFIVLDQNLFEVDVDNVGETHVLRTVFEGRTVHSADEGSESSRATVERRNVVSGQTSQVADVVGDATSGVAPLSCGQGW